MVEILEDRELFKNHAKVIFDAREDDEARTKWLENRTNSIGGSEIGAIAGFNDYATALTVYNDKMGISEKFKGNIHTKWGNRLEPHIRDWFQEDFKKATGIGAKTYEYPFMMVSNKYPFLSANIDGLAILEEDFTYYENMDTGEIKQIPKNEFVGIEIKTGSAFNKKVWAGEEIPSSYLCQIYHYMNVTGLKYFFIIYLLEKVVEWKVIPRNDDDIKMLQDTGIKFWNNNILAKVPPSPIGLECETKEILHQQALDDKSELIITENKLEEYQSLNKQIKALEQEKEQVKQLIFLDLKDAKKGTDGLYKVSRFEVKRDKLDLKILKEKYPVTYKSILEGQTEFVNMRVTKIK
jgi:putative phage-type endonuclease